MVEFWTRNSGLRLGQMDDEKDEDPREDDKKPYNPPALTVFGNIVKVTQGLNTPGDETMNGAFSH